MFTEKIKSSHQPSFAEHLRYSVEIPERPFFKRKNKLK